MSRKRQSIQFKADTNRPQITGSVLSKLYHKGIDVDQSDDHFTDETLHSLPAAQMLRREKPSLSLRRLLPFQTAWVGFSSSCFANSRATNPTTCHVLRGKLFFFETKGHRIQQGHPEVSAEMGPSLEWPQALLFDPPVAPSCGISPLSPGTWGPNPKV